MLEPPNLRLVFGAYIPGCEVRKLVKVSEGKNHVTCDFAATRELQAAAGKEQKMELRDRLSILKEEYDHNFPSEAIYGRKCLGKSGRDS